MSHGQDVRTPEPLKTATAELKEKMDPAPSDGILDKATVFSPIQRKELADQMEAFRKRENFRIFIAAYTFVYGEDSNQRAQRLGQEWLGKDQGIVIVFDKGGGVSNGAPVVGMAWQQDEEVLLPNSIMLSILKKAKAAADAEPAREPTKGLNAAVKSFIGSFGEVRPIIELKRQEARARQIKIVLIVLGAMFACLLLLSIINKHQRKAERKGEESYLFPEVEVMPRYGAPYGGGVVVQMHHAQPASQQPAR